jgi:hypothetical protein
MQNNNVLTVCCVMINLTFCMTIARGQNSVSRPALPTGVERDRDSERRLSGLLLSEIAKQGLQLPKIKKPSHFLLQMTCSAAIDPSQKKNAESLGLEMLQAEASELPNLLSVIPESARPTKDMPGMSVVVFRAKESDGKQILTVGFSGVDSWRSHVWGCLLTEDGCGDNTWQMVITPACRGIRR